jgi:hypothetical protein
MKYIEGFIHQNTSGAEFKELCVSCGPYCQVILLAFLVVSWLRHYATSWRVTGLIPNEITGFFNWPNSSSHSMGLGLTQPLTEMSSRNLRGGYMVASAWGLTTSSPSVSQLSGKYGCLDVSQPFGSPVARYRNSFTLPFLFLHSCVNETPIQTSQFMWPVDVQG